MDNYLCIYFWNNSIFHNFEKTVITFTAFNSLHLVLKG